MKNSNKTIYPVAIAFSLPLLILGGCAGHETVRLTTDTGVANKVTAESLEVVDGSQMETGIIVDFIPEQEIIEVVEPVDVPDEVAAQENTAQDTSTLNSKTPSRKTPKPDEGIIGFAFDDANINAEYGEMLWQHAQYLKENKSLILTISGHTDSSGARVYNEMLSMKRAKQVASILTDFGVPEDRIKIAGNASDQPLAGAINNREHRRVELDYEDQQLVSN